MLLSSRSNLEPRPTSRRNSLLRLGFAILPRSPRWTAQDTSELPQSRAGKTLCRMSHMSENRCAAKMGDRVDVICNDETRRDRRYRQRLSCLATREQIATQTEVAAAILEKRAWPAARRTVGRWGQPASGERSSFLDAVEKKCGGENVSQSSLKMGLLVAP